MEQGEQKMKKLITFFFLFILVCSSQAETVKIFDTDGVPRGLKIADDGSIDINLQDQVTRSIDIYMAKVVETGITLASPTTIGSYSFEVNSGHSIIAGQRISIVEPVLSGDHPHFIAGDVLSVSVNTITINQPISFTFDADSIVYTSTSSLVVDGSSDAIIFQLVNPFPVSADLVRIAFTIEDDSAMDDSTFGGLSELTRGCLVRIKESDTHYVNLFTLKSNGEMKLMAGPNYAGYSAKAPAGVYGFAAMLSFGGQDKHGVAIRIPPYGSIQLLIQDDLTGLTKFKCLVQGHFTN